MKINKKKRHKHFREATICTLCKNESSSLKVNKFCRCITKFEDYEMISCVTSGKKKELVPFIRSSEKLRLRAEYKRLVPDVENDSDRIKNPEKYSPRPSRVKKSSATVKQRTDKNEFYQSWEWSALRMSVLNKSGRKCMSCGETEGKICVDHIKPLHTHWDLRMTEDNLQVLCNACNMGKGINQFDFRWLRGNPK